MRTAFRKGCVPLDQMLNSKFALTHVFLAGAQNCYSCTTLDADQLLREVSDPDWQQWLTRVRNVPKTDSCGIKFDGDTALLNGAQSQQCQGGICMKLWFKERNGKAFS